MPTIPQRIATAFAVLSGRYGDVTKMAQDRERSRQSLYREADEVIEAVDGAAVEARIDELQRRVALPEQCEAAAGMGREVPLARAPHVGLPDAADAED